MPSRNGFLELQGLGKRYGDTPVVTDCNLSIAEGEFVCLLGPSGCGKTTLLRAVAGLEPVAGGEIRLARTVVSSASVSLPPEQRRIGMVFQDYALFPHLTVAENVAYGLKMRGVAKAARRKTALQPRASARACRAASQRDAR